MDYTAEEVRYCVESLIVSGCSNSRALTRGIKMLRAYADSLERRAEGVTDEVVKRAYSTWCECANDHPDSMRAALLAVWPAAAEPSQVDVIGTLDPLVRELETIDVPGVVLQQITLLGKFAAAARKLISEAMNARPAQRQAPAQHADASNGDRATGGFEDSDIPFSPIRERAAQAGLLNGEMLQAGADALDRFVDWEATNDEERYACVEAMWRAMQGRSPTAEPVAQPEPADSGRVTEGGRPSLPPPTWRDVSGVPQFSTLQMRRYGEECAQAALAAQGQGDGAWRECYIAIIKALGAMANVRTLDEPTNRDVIPREPIMEQVCRARAALDAFNKAISPASPAGVPDGWTDRHTSVQRFALQRFSSQAHNMANMAAQDKAAHHFKSGAIEQFMADAKTADECLSMLAAQESQSNG